MARNDLGFWVSVDIVYEVTMGIISRFELFVEAIMIFDVVCIIPTVSGYSKSYEMTSSTRNETYRCLGKNMLQDGYEIG
jgi:hypothetical protein